MSVANRNDDERRVVVTGMGIVTPIAETLDEYWVSLLAGRSAITRWKNMDKRIASKIGGDLSDFDFRTHLGRAGKGYRSDLVNRAHTILRSTPLAGCLTAAAALQAYTDAGLPDSRIEPERFGHILGGHNLNSDFVFENVQTFNDDPEYIEPLYGIMNFDTDILARTSELLTLMGPSWTVGNTCATGNIAILGGLDLLRAGRADAVLVTSCSGGFEPVLLHSWTILGVLSWQSFNDEPSRASRPFDVRREGLVPGEAAGAVVLETLAGARARGAHIHAEILGAASAGGACWQIKPNLEGEVRAIRWALQDAQVSPEQVDYVNPHAASTPQGDAAEVAAMKTVFGDHVHRLPVNATKSMLGHCLTAAGLVALVATILQMQNNLVHPSINLEEPDPEFNLDFVRDEAREHKIKIAVLNAFGIGGLNSCVVVGQAP